MPAAIPESAIRKVLTAIGASFGVDSVLPSRWCQPRSVIAAAQGTRAPAGRLVTASFMPTVLEIFVIRRAGGRPGVVPGESTAAGLVRPTCPRKARGPRDRHRGATPASAVHPTPGKRGQRGPSVAVRETADGVHRPPQLCTPTVVTVHTDRPCSTDARPLCVRGQRNMTIYSATR